MVNMKLTILVIATSFTVVSSVCDTDEMSYIFSIYFFQENNQQINQAEAMRYSN